MRAWLDRLACVTPQSSFLLIKLQKNRFTYKEKVGPQFRGSAVTSPVCSTMYFTYPNINHPWWHHNYLLLAVGGGVVQERKWDPDVVLVIQHFTHTSWISRTPFLLSHEIRHLKSLQTPAVIMFPLDLNDGYGLQHMSPYREGPAKTAAGLDKVSSSGYSGSHRFQALFIRLSRSFEDMRGCSYLSIMLGVANGFP